MGRTRTAWAAAPLALLVACGAGAEDGAPQACTMIGSASGINVIVDPPLAERADGVRLRACWDGTCVDAETALLPGQKAVDEGCDGEGPDAACSASMTPDGTMQGFVEIAELPVGDVEVTSVVLGGTTELEQTAETVRAQPTYPNGEDCEPGGNQAAITLG